MTSSLTKNRIESIDLLKGLVMVIMALDHVRDYTHAPSFLYNPTDPAHTSWPIFFTRWITDFCAPTFSFLAGLSAFLVSKRKTTGELSAFLFKRGLWLIFIELTVVNFAWFFDVHFRTPGLITIWSLGASMIVLSALVHLPIKAILVFSSLLIFGHNLLDNVHFRGSITWAALHDGGEFPFDNNYYHFEIWYPIVPWIAVMALGYCFGPLYDKTYDGAKRRKTINIAGASAIALFIILSAINKYGDKFGWKYYPTTSQTLMSVFNPLKYPPSLLYLLMTMGPALIFLANAENLKGKVVDFFSTFGKVPFFYYIIHIYVVHAIAMLLAQLTGFGWRSMIIFGGWVGDMPALKGYGFRLWVVYAIWIFVIALLYPVCKKFADYKLNYKEKWWLSYL